MLYNLAAREYRKVCPSMLALVTWGTFDSASGGTFQSDTDSTIHSDGVGTRSAERSQTYLTATVVNGLPVSLTSYANFVVKNALFSVTVVNEMQVLLTIFLTNS